MIKDLVIKTAVNNWSDIPYEITIEAKTNSSGGKLQYCITESSDKPDDSADWQDMIKSTDHSSSFFAANTTIDWSGTKCIWVKETGAWFAVDMESKIYDSMLDNENPTIEITNVDKTNPNKVLVTVKAQDSGSGVSKLLYINNDNEEVYFDGSEHTFEITESGTARFVAFDNVGLPSNEETREIDLNPPTPDYPFDPELGEPIVVNTETEEYDLKHSGNKLVEANSTIEKNLTVWHDDKNKTPGLQINSGATLGTIDFNTNDKANILINGNDVTISKVDSNAINSKNTALTLKLSENARNFNLYAFTETRGSMYGIDAKALDMQEDFNGTICVTSKASASALYSDNGNISLGEMNGEIFATGETAAAIKANTISGKINGKIYVGPNLGTGSAEETANTIRENMQKWEYEDYMAQYDPKYSPAIKAKGSDSSITLSSTAQVYGDIDLGDEFSNSKITFESGATHFGSVKSRDITYTLAGNGCDTITHGVTTAAITINCENAKNGEYTLIDGAISSYKGYTLNILVENKSVTWSELLEDGVKKSMKTLHSRAMLITSI